MLATNPGPGGRFYLQSETAKPVQHMITRVSRIFILALLSSVMCAEGMLSAPFSTSADAAGLIQDSPVTQLLDNAQAGIRRGDLAGAAVA